MTNESNTKTDTELLKQMRDEMARLRKTNDEMLEIEEAKVKQKKKNQWLMLLGISPFFLNGFEE